MWRAWVSLWDHREDAAALALLRISVAAVLLVDFLQVHALVDALWSPLPAGYARSAGSALWLAATLSLSAVLLGLLTPVACGLFVLLSAQLAHLAPEADRGIDMMLRIALGVLACSRCNARFSLDALLLRRLGRPLSQTVPAWPRYLLLLQLLWIYFSAGTNKAGAEWGPLGDFAALGNILTDPHFARFDPSWIWPPLTRLATAATMLFELTAPLYLALYYFAATPLPATGLRRLATRLRPIWLAAGVAFHLGIALTMKMGIFPWGMLALYPALLLPRDLRCLSR